MYVALSGRVFEKQSFPGMPITPALAAPGGESEPDATSVAIEVATRVARKYARQVRGKLEPLEGRVAAAEAKLETAAAQLDALQVVGSTVAAGNPRLSRQVLAEVTRSLEQSGRLRPGPSERPASQASDHQQLQRVAGVADRSAEILSIICSSAWLRGDTGDDGAGPDVPRRWIQNRRASIDQLRGPDGLTGLGRAPAEPASVGGTPKGSPARDSSRRPERCDARALPGTSASQLPCKRPAPAKSLINIENCAPGRPSTLGRLGGTSESEAFVPRVGIASEVFGRDRFDTLDGIVATSKQE